MSQADIIELLENSKVPLSSREIAEIMKDVEVKIVKDLKQLLKYNEVECIELDKMLAMKFYKCKRRLRLFYI